MPFCASIKGPIDNSAKRSLKYSKRLQSFRAIIVINTILLAGICLLLDVIIHEPVTQQSLLSEVT